jgi:hypothetical protein
LLRAASPLHPATWTAWRYAGTPPHPAPQQQQQQINKSSSTQSSAILDTCDAEDHHAASYALKLLRPVLYLPTIYHQLAEAGYFMQINFTCYVYPSCSSQPSSMRTLILSAWPPMVAMSHSSASLRPRWRSSAALTCSQQVQHQQAARVQSSCWHAYC